jgi:RNA polymerase sigma factor (sigma-70 family)
MEVSALKYSGGIRLHGRSSLLRLQSDDRLISLVRRGNVSAFEVLVGRYDTRLLAFCRHLLGSREDAEDVLQEVFAAAFNALLADDRPINARPWLFRIARNRSLNHLRRTQAIGVDSMDVHYSEHGASTADKVHEREDFRILVGDIHELPESQKTALVLREMDALSYEQIAEVMETSVPSVKSLLVRARVSLAEAAEARLLSCDEVRIELGEIAEGLRRRPSPLVRRHLKSCTRCSRFKVQLRQTNRALAALLPIGPLAVLRKLAWAHLPHSAGSGAAAGSTAIAGGTAAAGSTAGSIATVGFGAVATKAAVGLAAAALVTGAAVEVHHLSAPAPHTTSAPLASAHQAPTSSGSGNSSGGASPSSVAAAAHSSARRGATNKSKAAAKRKHKKTTGSSTTTLVASTTPPPTTTTTTTSTSTPKPSAPGRDQTQTDPTVLASPTDTTATTTTAPPVSSNPTGTTTTTEATIAPVVPAPTTTTSTTTTTTTTTPPPIATQ